MGVYHRGASPRVWWACTIGAPPPGSGGRVYHRGGLVGVCTIGELPLGSGGHEP